MCNLAGGTTEMQDTIIPRQRITVLYWDITMWLGYVLPVMALRIDPLERAEFVGFGDEIWWCLL